MPLKNIKTSVNSSVSALGFCHKGTKAHKDFYMQRSVRRALPSLVLFTFCFLLSASDAFAQQQQAPSRRGSRIINDTVKQVYGPRTSRYFYESDVFFNKEKKFQIDTLIKNFHRWNYVQANNNLYQDLGNIGTAIQPIFYQAPDVIGQRSGAHVYDLYWDLEPVRYFDTKSPYSNMKVILGGKGRSITRGTFSRNINPRWNFGLTYRGLLIDKQLLRRGKGDRITRSHYYDAYTTYQSKDSSYRIFANIRRMYHRVNEFGGALVDGSDSSYLAYFDPNARPRLNGPESNDLRMNLHLYHQYAFGKGFQFYHMFDRYRQRNVYRDIRNDQSNIFFGDPYSGNDSLKDATKFKAFRNEVGIKGNLAKLFYNGYAAIRHFSYSNNHEWLGDSVFMNEAGNELYLGGRMALQLDSINEVNGWLEVNDKGGFRLQGEIQSKWFEARVKQLIYPPAFNQKIYFGAYDYWNHSGDSTENLFTNTSVTQLNGYLHYKTSVIDILPGLTFTRLGNYVFFKKDTINPAVREVFPVQSNGSQIIASPELRLALTFFRHITFSTQAIYTTLLENADDAIRVPELFVNSQLSYANIFFNGNLDMHAGVDVHWKSAYYAPLYDPAIRQFYNQNEVECPAFPLVDIFFNAKIKRGRIFIKYHNLIQAFTKQGYFPTPYYPGQANVLDFGFDWSFYD